MKIYGNNNCYKCKIKVEECKQKNIPFEYIDIGELSEAEINALIKRYGAVSLPIVEN